MFEQIHHFQQLITLDISGDSGIWRGLPAGPSCVGYHPGGGSCGPVFNTAPNDTNGLWFGATHLQQTTFNSHGLYYGGKTWLSDDEGLPIFSTDNGSVPGVNFPNVGGGHFMVGSSHGMYSNYSSINAFWKDTTNMDNLRGADITASSVAGSTETIASNTKALNVRGGHSVHSNTDETYFNSSGLPI